MKKLIFKKFAKDLTKFFLLASISVTLIVWVIQAVNFLDLVTEDGHGFKIYFLYTLLSLPKIFSKTLPFIYFASVYYIILKYETNNELIIFWTIGIKKIEFINVLIKFSIFYLIFQLLLTTYIVPKTLDQARSFIRSSSVDLFSSIIKEKEFIDTVKNLTIFVENKSKDGRLNNIFLKEDLSNGKYQIVYAKRGLIDDINNKNILLLYEGKILNKNKNKTDNLKFSKTEINLSRFTTKTTTHPKIQETSTYLIFSCIIFLNDLSNSFIGKKLKKPIDETLNCRLNKLNDSFQEFFKRTVLPLYLPILSLIACLIIIKSKDDYDYFRYKFLLFVFGVCAIIISEISIKYSGTQLIQNLLLISLPILLFIFIYGYFIKKFKIPNLVTK